MAYKLVIALLAFLLIYLQATFWLGDGGVANIVALEKEKQRLVETNQQLKDRNLTLAAEVKDLKSGLDAVEDIARKELGMVKKGETFYLIIDGES